ncbi:NAD(P)-binding protein [Lojkania enalia]|uniref:NAD(P)-binding protein n=1 Tax=Lojkania enalia TaxID=147567 RepID=A0A9P4N948_9PLEO|nr:NAD(P)-binding protein [Didymosphaeria enalia]
MADQKNVLVFGPTGQVGSAAALEAGKRGAKVWLAMRDPSKTIKGISKADEVKYGFERIKADLSDPSSLTEAVALSGAKTAFVYVLHDAQDAMKASFQALEAAGITYIALLSSYSVRGAASDESNIGSDFVQRVHASAEIALEDVGIPFAALRAAYFDSNLNWYAMDLQSAEIQVLHPQVQLDYLAPEDVGAVAGALIVTPDVSPDSPSKIVYICGPDLMTSYDAWEVVGKVFGRRYPVKSITEQQFIEKNSFLPEGFVVTMVNGLRKMLPPATWYPKELHDEAVGNIRKYAGREPISYESWLEANKAVFVRA